MNSFSDLSQISDIQKISRISRSNCSRLMGRIDSLQNLFEQQCSLTSSTSKNTTNQGSNHLDKTLKCLSLCEENIGEHLKAKIILDCIKEVSVNANGTLPEEAAVKLRGLLLNYELNKYMRLPCTVNNVQEELNVLGICRLPKYEFSYEEMLDTKCCVETLLREKIHKFVLRYEQMGGNVKEILRTTECNMHRNLFEPHEVQVLQWKDKIDELRIQYETDIAKCRSLLNQWSKLKNNDISQFYSKKAEHVLLQAEVAEMQAKITKLSCIVKMFKETPITIDAYSMLNTAVDEKLCAIMSELKKKENLKRQYESLHNTEYDNVLKVYLNLCKSIKKKKEILGKL